MWGQIQIWRISFSSGGVFELQDEHRSFGLVENRKCEILVYGLSRRGKLELSFRCRCVYPPFFSLH